MPENNIKTFANHRDLTGTIISHRIHQITKLLPTETRLYEVLCLQCSFPCRFFYIFSIQFWNKLNYFELEFDILYIFLDFVGFHIDNTISTQEHIENVFNSILDLTFKC